MSDYLKFLFWKEKFASPYSDGDTRIIATRQHKSIVKIFEGVGLSFWDLSRSSPDIWLKLSN